MAWTSVKTWVANEVVDENDFNQQIRDQFTVLSTHQHTGAAGQGNDELSGLDILDFDDQAASPAQAGRLMRNGNNLEWYGAAMVAITEADAVATTASPRTLGTGGRQGAPGSHGHGASNRSQGAWSPDALNDTDSHLMYYDSSTWATESIPASTTETIRTAMTQPKQVGVWSFFITRLSVGSGGNCKVYIEADGVEVASVTRSAGTDGGFYLLLAVHVKTTGNISWTVKVENNATAATKISSAKTTVWTNAANLATSSQASGTPFNFLAGADLDQA